MHPTIKVQEKTRLMPTHTYWRGSPRGRLAFCMLIAALLVAGALSLLRYPVASVSLDPVDLFVRIVEIEPEHPEEIAETTPPEPIPEALPPPEVVEPLPEPQPPPEQESVAEDIDHPEPWTDWRAIGEEVVKEVVESEAKTVSVNPVFDEKRAIAAVKFRPSEAPEKKEIWDNVEKDYLGRTILRDGDCYRVLDDPSAVYRDVFENFTQFMTFCEGGGSGGVELPWVAEVREQHAYLQRRFDSRSSAIID